MEGLAREGRLASLTVTQLREWLGEQGLLKSGRKGDLIDRITEYVESEKDKDKDQKNDEPIKNK